MALSGPGISQVSPPERNQLPMLNLVDISEPGSPDHVSAFSAPRLPPPLDVSPLRQWPGLDDYDRERLAKTPTVVVAEELQRRLGMPDLDKTGVPYSMMDEELQKRLRVAAQEQGAEAFMTLGVPQSDNDSE